MNAARLKTAIEHHKDDYRRLVLDATLLPRWNDVMQDILKMPVPTYSEPAPTAGEIDTLKRRPNGERETDMWNQGNGNGQGNGYGQQQQYQQGYGAQDTYDRLNNSREVGGARFPFLEGTGRYVLCTLEEFPHSQDGPSARALFKVLESKDGKHAVGSFVVKIWKLVKPPKFQNSLSDGELFTDFCRKLKGAPQSHPMGADMRVLMKDRAAEQLARGTVIDAVAVPNQKKTWINIYWNTVQQGPQDIASFRQRLEAEGIPDTGGQRGTGGGQFQNAPHPSQMQGQYPAQQAQAPQQGYQMQNTQWSLPPGAQPGYGPTPQQQIQGAPNPAYYPNAPAQPQQGPAQGPPPGGYLANVPVNNGNGQGNGGQGTW